MTTPGSEMNTFDRIRVLNEVYRIPFDVVGAEAQTAAERYVAQLVTEVATVEARALRAIARLTRDLSDGAELIQNPTGHVNSSGVVQNAGTAVDVAVAELAALRAQLTQAVTSLFPEA